MEKWWWVADLVWVSGCEWRWTGGEGGGELLFLPGKNKRWWCWCKRWWVVVHAMVMMMVNVVETMVVMVRVAQFRVWGRGSVFNGENSNFKFGNYLEMSRCFKRPKRRHQNPLLRLEREREFRKVFKQLRDWICLARWLPRVEDFQFIQVNSNLIISLIHVTCLFWFILIYLIYAWCVCTGSFWVV